MTDLESMTGGWRATAAREMSRSSLTRTVAKKAGIHLKEGEKLTGAALNSRGKKLGSVFDKLLGPDRRVKLDTVKLDKIMDEVVPSAQHPAVKQVLRNLKQKEFVVKDKAAKKLVPGMPSDTISGMEAHKQLRKLRRAKMTEAGKLDDNLDQVIDWLDDQVRASLSPGELARFEKLNKSYSNYLDVKDMYYRSGMRSKGFITPEAIQGVVGTKRGRYGHKWDDLANAATEGLKGSHETNVFHRAIPYAAGGGALALGSAAAGAGAGYQENNPGGAGIGGGLGLAVGALAPFVLGRGMMNPAVQAMLKNRTPISPMLSAGSRVPQMNDPDYRWLMNVQPGGE
jgi:hypothetical protein